MRRIPRTLAILLSLPVAGCFVIVSRSGSVEPVERGQLEPRMVESPMKAFFVDGSTAVFADGAEISSDSIHGAGTMYSAGLLDTTNISAVSLDSLVGIEAFQGRTNQAASVVASVGLTGIALFGAAALYKAIFGSCPTFYVEGEDGPVLQAEGFSYSIAPLLEGRDLDATALAPSADGVLRLELRNEALETHYINHLDLLAVDHDHGTRVVPNDLEVPIVVRDEVPPSRAVDRSGRDLRTVLRHADEDVFSTDETRVAAASNDDPFDHVELSFPRPAEGEPVLVLRLRNSLLTTVLFYDLMLERAGVQAVDWIGQDMDRIGTVVELGKWFQESMGLRVEVFEDGKWLPAGRIPDTGPIAWEDVAVVLPRGDAPTVRVRVRFLADAWRIDAAAVGRRARLRGESRVPVARIVDDGAPVASETVRRISEPDDEYLATYPGTSAMLEFDAPAQRADTRRTYLLASQGYYTEWIRAAWLRGSSERPTRFRPGDETVETLMSLWLERKEAFEAEFHSSRLPVR